MDRQTERETTRCQKKTLLLAGAFSKEGTKSSLSGKQQQRQETKIGIDIGSIALLVGLWPCKSVPDLVQDFL